MSYLIPGARSKSSHSNLNNNNNSNAKNNNYGSREEAKTRAESPTSSPKLGKKFFASETKISFLPFWKFRISSYWC